MLIMKLRSWNESERLQHIDQRQDIRQFFIYSMLRLKLSNMTVAWSPLVWLVYVTSYQLVVLVEVMLIHV